MCLKIGPWLENDPFGQEHEFFSRLKFHSTHVAFTYDVVSYYVRHNREHVFDHSVAFEHGVLRVLSTIQGLILFSPHDSRAERQALAIEFTKLGVRLYRHRDYRTALLTWGIAFWLRPHYKRLLGCMCCLPLLLLQSVKSRFSKERLPDSSPPAHAETVSKSCRPVVHQPGSPEENGCSDSAEGELLAWWTGGYNNWGDIVTPFILQSLTNRPVRRGHGNGCIYSVGSIADKVRSGGVIWGCGILSKNHCPKPFPANVTVCAVRGPLTRRVLLKAGLDVPEVYGDPVLLLPYLCQADIEGDGIGIICHYNDASHLGKILGTDVYRVIDIQAGLKEVISAVLACEAIVSTSLHGLVLAEAYGKPAAWLQIDRGKRLAGGDFKFRDYLLSTKREIIKNEIRSGEALDLEQIKWLSPPTIDLQPLLDAFPAKSGLTLATLKAVSLSDL